MYDPHRHHRRSIRLKGWDYSSSALYFVTICVNSGQCVLGSVEADEVTLTDFGRITLETLQWLESQYLQVILDAWVIMPNHIHFIVAFVDVDNPSYKRKTLGGIIGAFKTVSSKAINQLRDAEDNKFWQRDYYERIVRNEASLNKIRHYINNNPATWPQDQLHPNAPPNKFNRD